MSLKPAQPAALFTMFFAVASFAGTCIAASPKADEWASRLHASAAELLAMPQIEQHKRSYVAMLGSISLAESGHADQAVALAESTGDDRIKQGAFQAIAAGQSKLDDVDGAIETANRLAGSFKQRTLSLIVARQAQRGDIQDALALLSRIEDEGERGDAIGLICSEHIKHGRYEEAITLSREIRDSETRARVEQQIADARTEPSLGDPDYVERKMASYRKLMALWQPSDDLLHHWRLMYRADVAQHMQDPHAFVQAMEEALANTHRMSRTSRRSALLGIGSKCAEYDQPEMAKFALREALPLFLDPEEQVNPFDFGSLSFIAGGDGAAAAMVKVMEHEEIEQWIDRALAHEDTTEIAAAVIENLAASGEDAMADKMFAKAGDAYQRFMIAAYVLPVVSR